MKENYEIFNLVLLVKYISIPSHIQVHFLKHSSDQSYRLINQYNVPPQLQPIISS